MLILQCCCAIGCFSRPFPPRCRSVFLDPTELGVSRLGHIGVPGRKSVSPDVFAFLRSPASPPFARAASPPFGGSHGTSRITFHFGAGGRSGVWRPSDESKSRPAGTRAERIERSDLSQKGMEILQQLLVTPVQSYL